MTTYSTILGIVGIGAGMWASNNAANAAQDNANAQAAANAVAAANNSAISRYDALVARQDALYAETSTGDDVREFLRQANQLVSAQKTNFAKSGVTMTGSAKTVTDFTRRELARRTEIIRFNGLTAAQAKLSLAKRYDMLAESGLRDAAAQSFQIQQAGAAASNAARINGFAATMNGLYRMSEGGAFE